MTTLEMPLLQLTAEDLMSREVLVVPRGLSLRAAAHLLAQAHVSGAPVVDEEGRCVGVLSAIDLMRWVDRGDRASQCVGKPACVCCDWQLDALHEMPEDAVEYYMTTDVVTARPNASVGELARWMVNAHIHRVVIVNDARRPVGVVSSMDILGAVAHLDALRRAEAH